MILSQLTFYCRLSDPSPSHLEPRDLTAWPCEKESESEVTQSCLTLCHPMDCSPPGSSVHGILQGRTLEWVAISFSRKSSWPRDRTQVCLHCRWILYLLSHQGSPWKSWIMIKYEVNFEIGFAGGTSRKESASQCRRCDRCRLDLWVGKISWRRKWQPTPVFFPGESHGQRRLVG